MAAPSKVQEMAQSFKKRLEDLGCPFTDGVEESWIVELVFRPGESRIRLLQWLFSRFDSKLNDVLDPQHASVDSRMDSRIQRLLFVASTVGLCKQDDADLIRGNCSVASQYSFMDQLLDLVCIMDAADDPQTKAMQSPGMVSSAMTLEEQFSRDCAFVDSLAEQEKTGSLFSSQVKLLPPDVLKQVNHGWEEKGYQSSDMVPVPDIQALLEQSNQLARDIQRQNELLADLKKNFEYPDHDPQANVKVNRTLKLVLSELSQLVVGFSYCFENEMRQWCNKEPPRLTQLGATFKRVHTLLVQFTSLLSGLDTIRRNHTKLCNKSETSQSEDRDSQTDSQNSTLLASVGQEAIESFQECIDVLEESLVRIRDNNTANNTLNISTISSIKLE